MSKIPNRRGKFERVFVRDAGMCHVCRTPTARASATLDHLVPRSQGGNSRVENLALAHRKCNSYRTNAKPERLARRIATLQAMHVAPESPP